MPCPALSKWLALRKLRQLQLTKYLFRNSPGCPSIYGLFVRIFSKASAENQAFKIFSVLIFSKEIHHIIYDTEMTSNYLYKTSAFTGAPFLGVYFHLYLVNIYIVNIPHGHSDLLFLYHFPCNYNEDWFNLNSISPLPTEYCAVLISH